MLLTPKMAPTPGNRLKAPVVTITTKSKSQFSEIEYVENNMKKSKRKMRTITKRQHIYSGSAILPTSTLKFYPFIPFSRSYTRLQDCFDLIINLKEVAEDWKWQSFRVVSEKRSLSVLALPLYL